MLIRAATTAGKSRSAGRKWKSFGSCHPPGANALFTRWVTTSGGNSVFHIALAEDEVCAGGGVGAVVLYGLGFRERQHIGSPQIEVRGDGLQLDVLLLPKLADGERFVAHGSTRDDAGSGGAATRSRLPALRGTFGPEAIADAEVVGRHLVDDDVVKRGKPAAQAHPIPNRSRRATRRGPAPRRQTC